MNDNLARVQTENEKNQSPSTAAVPRWRAFVNSLIAAEISSASRYFDAALYLRREGDESPILYNLVEAPRKEMIQSLDEIAPSGKECAAHTAVVLNGTFNHDHDIEGLLRRAWGKLSRSSRVISVCYNPYLRWLYHLANRYGIRKGEEPSTFLTSTDLSSIAKLAHFEVVRVRPVGFVPWELKGVGTWLNRILATIPVIRALSLAWVVILRPIKPEARKPSLSIVIPARNEKGNIESALQRMPNLGGELEVIFVEGHSSDGTWEEIQRVAEKYKDSYKIKTFRQTGKGKADAVRLGFANASGELLTILDADLTMPPELLGRFYDAWSGGLADFVNGNRLTYPMEGEAMKFLNWLGNIFFAKALSAVLDTRLGDSLCGTKLMSRRDYERFGAWRRDFGDFDPFGDFELIFPACSLGLGVVDVPIRYRDRVYGSTNIRRFYHGMMLFKMTGIGYVRLKLGQQPKPVQ